MKPLLVYRRFMAACGLAFAFLFLAGCGGSSSSSSSGGGGIDPLRMVYALNTGEHTVSWFAPDPHSGAPRHLAYIALEEAESASDIAVVPDGERLFVADPNGRAIHQLAADADNGSLRHQTLAEDSNRSFVNLAMAPDGEHLYATAFAHDLNLWVVRAYALEEGSLVGASHVEEELDIELTNASQLAVSPDGGYLHVGGALGGPQILGKVDTFELADGGANPVRDDDQTILLPEGQTVRAIAVHPDGDHLYMAATKDQDDRELFTAVRNQGEWELEGEVIGFEAPQMDYIFVSPEGSELYMNIHASPEQDSTQVVLLDEDLLPVDEADPVVLHGADMVQIDPAGEVLLVSFIGNYLLSFDIEGVDPEDYSEAVRAWSLARPGTMRMAITTGDAPRFQPTHLYAGDWESDGLERFVVTSTGGLEEGTIEYDLEKNGVRGLTMHPYQDLLIAALRGDDDQDEGQVGAYLIDEQGLLDPPQAVDFQSRRYMEDPAALALEASGRVLLMPGRATSDDTFEGTLKFQVLDADGVDTTLANRGEHVTLDYPLTDVTTDPAGRGYFLVRGDGRIGWSDLHTETVVANESGYATELDFISDMDSVAGVAVTPDGMTLVITGVHDGNDVVMSYIIDWMNEELGHISTRELDFPAVDLDVHPGGDWVIVAGVDGATDTLEVFPLAPETAGQAGSLEIGARSDLVTTIGADQSFSSVLVSPDGETLYVGRKSNAGNEGIIVMYDFDPEEGVLNDSPDYVWSVEHPKRLAIRTEAQ